MEGREARWGEVKGPVKLFGVTIRGGDVAEEPEGGGGAAELMRKSKSMSNLASATAENGAGERGYLSDGGLRKCRRRRRRAGAVGHDRKKGIPWTEEEHRTFLEGLEKLGKGDWRGISRKFVVTRTPTQVASHAQKYFMRQMIPSNKRRRSSLFDVVFNDGAPTSETAAMASLNKTRKGSEEINLLYQDNKKVGVPELNSVPRSSLGPERRPHFRFTEKWVDFPDPENFPEPASFSYMDGMSAFMKGKHRSVEPEVSQTLSLLLDAPQSAVSSKLHTNQTTFSREFQLIPCCPVQAKTLHKVVEGNDLELSIAPPNPLSLSKTPPQNKVGMIRVV